MATHILEFVPSPYSVGDDVWPYDIDVWRATVDVIVENRYQARDGRPIRHTLTFAGADNCHRETHGGPVFQHARAHLIPQASVIADSPITQAPSIDAAIGDLIVFTARDTVLRIIAGPANDDTQIEILTTTAPTLDHSAWAQTTNARTA